MLFYQSNIKVTNSTFLEKQLALLFRKLIYFIIPLEPQWNTFKFLSSPVAKRSGEFVQCGI